MLLGWLERLVAQREEQPYDVRAALAITGFVGATRACLEAVLCGSVAATPASVVACCTFYLLTGLLFTAAAVGLTGETWVRVLRVVPVALLVGLVPPFVDRAAAGEACRYSYNLGGFATWTPQLYAPEQGRGIGETLGLGSAVVLLAVYVRLKSRGRRGSWARTLAAVPAGYAIVFYAMTAAGTSARLLVETYARGPLPGPYRAAAGVGLAATIDLLGAAAVFLALRPTLARRLGTRLLHAAPFVAVLALGAAVARWERPGDVPLLHAVPAAAWLTLGWLASLTHNDAFDADAPARPTGDDVWMLGAIAWAAAAVALAVDARLGGLLLAFNLSAAAYNHPFYRAKRWFPANYKIEGAWGWLAFMLGAVAVTPQGSAVGGGTLLASGLVFGGWSVFNAFKDYKDVRADRRAGVQTAYVLVWRRGGSLRRLHLGLRTALGVATLVPIGIAAGLGRWWAPAALPFAGAMVLALGRGPRAGTVRLALAALTAYLAALAAAFV